MSAHHQEKPKKSFEFRMCKKVAELTQVVHMLFTRNHEKEVEIEALKKSYEHEIEIVLGDANSRINKLQSDISDITQKGISELENSRRIKESELTAKEVEWRQKFADNDKLLQEERMECQNLRDLLINAQRDIEKLRQGVNDQLTSKSDEISWRDRELEKLRSQLAAMEVLMKDAQRDAQGVISELEKSNEKLDVEVRQLHSLMDSSHKTRDQLLTRNKQLEGDMKAFKREFNKKVTEVVNNQLKNKAFTSPDTTEELERLRREVQRYRLELSNRDNNFNRMFTEKQPMVVNQKRNSLKSPPSGAIYTYTNANGQGQLNQSAMAMTSSHQTHQPSLANAQMPSFLKERQSILKNGFMDVDKSIGHLERQQTFPDRVILQDRHPLSASNDKGPSLESRRPQTQGPTFMHERTFINERQSHKQPFPSSLFPEEPNQMMPQRSVAISSINESPMSSSLPSICSTPEQKRLSKQLTKPKPLSREVLYGK